MENAIKILPTVLFTDEGDWGDYYLEIKHLKKGDIFYESDNRNSINYELKALEDAKKERGGWICKAQTTGGEIVELYVSATTFSTSFPGPNLFKTPQILSFVDGVGYAYQVC